MDNGWHDIATAPRDGTRVLLLIEGGAIEGYWDGPAFNEWEVVSLPSHGCGCCLGSNEDPTHWMPLPAPPGAKDGRG